MRVRLETSMREDALAHARIASGGIHEAVKTLKKGKIDAGKLSDLIDQLSSVEDMVHNLGVSLRVEMASWQKMAKAGGTSLSTHDLARTATGSQKAIESVSKLDCHAHQKTSDEKTTARRGNRYRFSPEAINDTQSPYRTSTQHKIWLARRAAEKAALKKYFGLCFSLPETTSSPQSKLPTDDRAIYIDVLSRQSAGRAHLSLHRQLFAVSDQPVLSPHYTHSHTSHQEPSFSPLPFADSLVSDVNAYETDLSLG